MSFPQNEFLVRPATRSDLPSIAEIYNESIRSGSVTADTEIQTDNSMQEWFLKHNNPLWPVWVILDSFSSIVGYCSLNCFYPRPAYNITAEISIYIGNQHRGKKYGKRILDFLEEEARKRGILNLLAFVFEENMPAVKFFSKFGFEVQARLPEIARMPRHQYRTLLIFRKHIK